MIEGTPGKPYGGLLAHYNVVEANMRLRREEVQQLLQPGEALMSLTSFPRQDLFSLLSGSLQALILLNFQIYLFGFPGWVVLISLIHQRKLLHRMELLCLYSFRMIVFSQDILDSKH